MSVRNEKSGAVSRGDNEIPASSSFQLAPAGQPPRRNSSLQLASSYALTGRAQLTSLLAFPAGQRFTWPGLLCIQYTVSNFKSGLCAKAPTHPRS